MNEVATSRTAWATSEDSVVGVVVLVVGLEVVVDVDDEIVVERRELVVGDAAVVIVGVGSPIARSAESLSAARPGTSGDAGSSLACTAPSSSAEEVEGTSRDGWVKPASSRDCSSSGADPVPNQIVSPTPMRPTARPATPTISPFRPVSIDHQDNARPLVTKRSPNSEKAGTGFEPSAPDPNQPDELRPPGATRLWRFACPASTAASIGLGPSRWDALVHSLLPPKPSIDLRRRRYNGAPCMWEGSAAHSRGPPRTAGAPSIERDVYPS